MPKPAPTPKDGAIAAARWPEALAEHGRWLRTAVLARLGEPLAVEDVMQELALACVKQGASVDPQKLAPWLYRLAVRQTLLYRRRQGRFRKLLGRYAECGRPAFEAGDGDPLAWLVAEERRTLVRDALRRLPARDAEILLLKYTEQWNYCELAWRLGVSVSAVEARLHRARAKLRAELSRLNVVEPV